MSEEERKESRFILQVVGAGLEGTGVEALQEALEFLGLSPCYHTFRTLRLFFPIFPSHFWKEKKEKKKNSYAIKFRRLLVMDFTGEKDRIWSDIERVLPLQRSAINWDKVFEKENFQAALDAPVSPYYQAIYEFYKKKQRQIGSKKGIKVILTVRDPQKWHKSG